MRLTAARLWSYRLSAGMGWIMWRSRCRESNWQIAMALPYKGRLPQKYTALPQSCLKSGDGSTPPVILTASELRRLRGKKNPRWLQSPPLQWNHEGDTQPKGILRRIRLRISSNSLPLILEGKQITRHPLNRSIVAVGQDESFVYLRGVGIHWRTNRGTAIEYERSYTLREIARLICLLLRPTRQPRANKNWASLCLPYPPAPLSAQRAFRKHYEGLMNPQIIKVTSS